MNTALQTQFHNIPVSVIDHNGKKWLTSEQVGICLGYGKEYARQSINKLHDRHADEFTNADTCEVNLTSQGQSRAMRIFSDTGCYKLGFFASTKVSKEFRQFASQVLSGQSPAIIEAMPATVEARLDRLENVMTTMATHIGTLAEVSVQQAQKLDVTARYISLLEINQKGKVKITRPIEAQVLALKAQGMPQADIARLLRISTASVNLLVHGKYRFGGAEAQLPSESVASLLDQAIEAERAGLLEKLGSGK